LTIAWMPLAMARSDSDSSSIFASRAFSPSSARAAALSSAARSFMAARSSAVNPLAFLPFSLAFFTDVFVSFSAVLATGRSSLVFPLNRIPLLSAICVLLASRKLRSCRTR
jgi:hypothetical protein